VGAKSWLIVVFGIILCRFFLSFPSNIVIFEGKDAKIKQREHQQKINLQKN